MATKKQVSKLRFAVLAADTVVFTVHDKKLQVLVVPSNPDSGFDGYDALPGGLITPNEHADDAAKRNLKRKGGLSEVYLEQLYTFSEVKRDRRGRVVALAYLGLVPYTIVGTESADARWVSVKGIGKLAYDHNTILKTGVERLRAKLSYTNIACQLVPKEFTLSELQEVYEVILGREVDKRNFRKKILELNVVQGTGKKRTGGANRPAELFVCSSKKVEVMEVL